MMDLALALALLLGAPADEAPAQAAASATPAQAPDPDRPALSPSELKALRDNNIFAPKTARKRPAYTPRGTSPRTPSAPAQPKPPVVTGIFMDLKLQCYVVVVEDRNEGSLKQFKEPKFLKTGDEVAGHKIGLVTAEKAAFIKGETTKDLRVGDPLPSTEGKVSLAPATEDPDAAPEEEPAADKGERPAEKTEIKPLDTEEKTKVLEKMKRERGRKNRPGSDEQ